MANTACQPVGTDVFGTNNIERCKKYVSSIQSKLDKAVAGNNKSNIRWYTHILSKKSRAVKILAVHRVTALNQGKYTAGTDGVRMTRGRKGINEQMKLSLLEAIDIKKEPSPIRRVYIPKPTGKKRPLGIPTLADRVIQDILRTTLEPITEYHASDNSYGFRPKRSCHDAIEHLFNKLSRRGSKRWILEGDIAGCFDNIDHDHILDTLKSWEVSENTVNIIGKMLRAKVFSDDRLLDTNTGTPQGGILSPMLANVALTALDDFCYENFGIFTQRGKKRGGNYFQNPIIRYADDFVIVCASEQEAALIKESIATFLKDSIGLELSDEKTKVTHIYEGFNFLGFNIRKYTARSPSSQIEKLLIKPQKEKVNDFLRRMQEVLDNNKTAKQESIIRMLNPMLQGFSMYYRFAVSKKTLSNIARILWTKLWKWAKRRHPNKSKGWITKKYYGTEGKRNWVFKDGIGNKIINVEAIPIVRFTILKSGMRVYADDKDTKEYWNKRVYTNALSQVYSIKVQRLIKKQRGICPCCGNPITKDDIADKKAHAHHMLPRSEGGTERPNNLRLLHQDCHVLAHHVLSRKEMAHWMRKKLNYVTKSNIVHFQKHPDAKVA